MAELEESLTSEKIWDNTWWYLLALLQVNRCDLVCGTIPPSIVPSFACSNQYYDRVSKSTSHSSLFQFFYMGQKCSIVQKVLVGDLKMCSHHGIPNQFWVACRKTICCLEKDPQSHGYLSRLLPIPFALCSFQTGSQNSNMSGFTRLLPCQCHPASSNLPLHLPATV